MFTGLIEEVGQCVFLEHSGQGARLFVAAGACAASAEVGESIAVNGCCLTAVALEGGNVGFDLLEETLQRTNLGVLQPGAAVNLERALAADGRLGGHFVQGHVDGAVKLLDVTEKGSDLRLDFELPAAFARYVVSKGSIAVNGASLTVASVEEKTFSVWIIPHTRAHTNLGALRRGDPVNLEFDILAKYAERIMTVR